MSLPREFQRGGRSLIQGQEELEPRWADGDQLTPHRLGRGTESMGFLSPSVGVSEVMSSCWFE